MNFHNLWGPEFIPLHEKPDCQLTILILLAILCGVSWISDFKKIIHYLRLVFFTPIINDFLIHQFKNFFAKKRVSFKLHVSEARYDFDYKRAFKNKLFILQHDVKYAELITKL